MMRSFLKPVPFLAVAVAAVPAQAQTFAVRDARVFDGERVIESATVVVRDGLIAAVGADVEVPAGVAVIDGAGRTLMPGLIDAHTHSFTHDVLEAALSFGVTTVLDMFTQASQAAMWRAEQANGGARGRADVLSASTLVTATGGHGTQFGLPIQTLDAAADADAFIAARVQEGADYIKLVHDDGRVYGFDAIPTLDSATIAAVVAAAHARGKLAVAHVGTLAGARRAVGAGVDGLVHLWVDSLPSDAFVATIKRRGVFVVPTATVYESFGPGSAGEALTGDERLAPWIGPDERANVGRGLRGRPGSVAAFEPLMSSLSRLAEAGVPLLTGSDAPNPGTAHGVSVHRELELFVQAGVTPLDALRAATSSPADAFRLEGRGRIAPGARADLVLVDGDPTSAITDSRAIVAVWKAGVRYDRDARRAAIIARVEAARAPASGVDVPVGGLLISGFDQGNASVAVGAGWGITTDAMMGGSSTAAQEVVAGGAAGSSGALRVHGEAKAGAFPWAGTMYFPGAQPMAPADLSAARGFAFLARGGPGEWRVLVFTRATGQMPLIRTFTPADEWTEHTFAWADFNGSDGSDIMGIAIVAGSRLGPFEIFLDEVRLIR